MMRSVLLIVSALGVVWLGPLAFSAAPESGWGHVTGRIVFEGDLDDAKVRKRREDIPIHEFISSDARRRGVKPRLLRSVPNQRMVIDDKTRGIANVMVFSPRRPLNVHPELEHSSREALEVTLRDGQLHPAVLLLKVGQTVRLTSKDASLTYSVQSWNDPLVSGLVSPGKSNSWTAKRAEDQPFRTIATIQPGALSYWLVTDHPYAVLTNSEGSFRIENLPVGKMLLDVWHAEVGPIQQKVSVHVEADKTTELPPIVLTIDRLK